MLKKIIFAINLSVIIFVMLFQAFETKAAPGDLDPTFSASGNKFPISGKPNDLFMSRNNFQTLLSDTFASSV